MNINRTISLNTKTSIKRNTKSMRKTDNIKYNQMIRLEGPFDCAQPRPMNNFKI